VRTNNTKTIENLKNLQSGDFKFAFGTKTVKKTAPRVNYLMIQTKHQEQPQRINMRSPAISPERLDAIYNNALLFGPPTAKPTPATLEPEKYSSHQYK
jgi:hypothetical protein